MGAQADLPSCIIFGLWNGYTGAVSWRRRARIRCTYKSITQRAMDSTTRDIRLSKVTTYTIPGFEGNF